LSVDSTFRQEDGGTERAPAVIRVPDIRHIGDWLAGAAIFIVCLELVFSFGHVSLYGENALIELSQCMLLWASGALFIAAAVRAGDRISFLAFLWLALFVLALLMREIEFDGTRFATWRVSSFLHEIKYAFTGFLAVLLFVSSYRATVPVVRAGATWVLKGAGRWMAAGLAAYLLGDLGDKEFLFADKGANLMLEESAELIGTLCFFIAAHTALRRRSILLPSPQQKP
jgi:hypothetical protein